MNKKTGKISAFLTWILKVITCLLGGSWLIFTGTETHTISDNLNAGAIMIPAGIILIFWGLIILFLCPPSQEKENILGKKIAKEITNQKNR